MARGRKASISVDEAVKGIKWTTETITSKSGDPVEFRYPNFQGKLDVATAYFKGEESALKVLQAAEKGRRRMAAYNTPDPDQRVVDEIMGLQKSNPAAFAARIGEMTEALTRIASKVQAS